MRTGLYLFSIVFMLLGTPETLRAQLGELPPDPLASLEIEDVRAELVLYFPTPINSIDTSLRSMASPDSLGNVWTSLVIISADALRISSHTVANTGTGSSSASWWAFVQNPLEEDPRFLGDQSQSEMRRWYEDPAALEVLREAGLPGDSGQVRLDRTQDAWHFQVDLSESVMEGTCRLTGARERVSYEVPAYATVAATGPGSHFWVYSFEGHHMQECIVEDLNISGRGLLAQTMSTAASKNQVFANVQDGWRARAGLYRATR